MSAQIKNQTQTKLDTGSNNGSTDQLLLFQHDPKFKAVDLSSENAHQSTMIRDGLTCTINQSEFQI